MSELRHVPDADTGKMVVDMEMEGPMGEEQPVCFVCGGLPTATWMGVGGEFHSVCRDCAIEKLPLLIADAIAGNIGERAKPEWFDPMASQVVASFWRGVAYAMSRRGAIKSPVVHVSPDDHDS